MIRGPIVIDSSVGIPLVHLEPGRDVVRAAVDEWRATGRELLVPGLFWLEIVNSLHRRHRYPGVAVVEAIYELEELDMVTVEPDRAMRLAVIDLVERHTLTSYDALYLAVAEDQDALLATSDEALATAAGTRAVLFGGDSDRRRLSEKRASYGSEPTWPSWSGAGAYLAELRARALAGDVR